MNSNKLVLAMSVILFIASIGYVTVFHSELFSGKGKDYVENIRAYASWDEGYIEVTAGATGNSNISINSAHSYSMAYKTARIRAYEKLVENLHGISVDGQTYIKDEILTNSELKSVIKGILKDVRVVKEVQTELDGHPWVEVTLGLKLDKESILDAWDDGGSYDDYSSNYEYQQKEEEKLPDNNVTYREGQPDNILSEAKKSAAASSLFTGLIVDAGHLNLRPDYMPKILTEDGAVVYSGDIAEDYFVDKWGYIEYTNSMRKAVLEERVGKNPCVIKAVGADEVNGTDLIISDKEAYIIRNSNDYHGFLEKCGVIIIL